MTEQELLKIAQERFRLIRAARPNEEDPAASMQAMERFMVHHRQSYVRLTEGERVRVDDLIEQLVHSDWDYAWRDDNQSN